MPNRDENKYLTYKKLKKKSERSFFRNVPEIGEISLS